jgi:short-subunit dehydrogenase
LFNCVGSLTPASFEHLSETDINRLLATNIAAIAYGVQAVVPIMRRQGHGHIINVGSLGGIIPMPYEALYSATKFAVRGLTLSLRKELENAGIAVSLLSSGAVRTPMLDREALDTQSSLTFATRVLEPEEIAREIFNLILKPKNEVILPKKVAVLARLAGACPALLSVLYPFLRFTGRVRLASYRKIRPLTPAQITGAA